jgi:hypothetical protein
VSLVSVSVLVLVLVPVVLLLQIKSTYRSGTRYREPHHVQNKIGDPRGGWVGRRPKKDQGQMGRSDMSEAKKGPGPDFFPRNAKKRDKKKSKKKSVLDFLSIFLIYFRHDCFCTTFFVVYLNSHR